MIKFKIAGGTAKSTEHLCPTCRHCFMVNDSQKCTMIDPPVALRERVYSCSDYEDKRVPKLYDFESIAWVMVTKKASRDAGFVSPKEYKKKYKKDEEGED